MATTLTLVLRRMPVKRFHIAYPMHGTCAKTPLPLQIVDA